MSRDTKEIGYFDFLSPTEIVCDGNACVIAGSENTINKYLSIANPGQIGKHTIRKTRFGDIVQGMSRGGSYSFDEEAYN